MLRTTSTAIALAAVLGLGLSGPAFAGDDAKMKDENVSASHQAMQKEFENYAVAHPEKVRGMTVEDYTGTKIGEIEKVVQSEEDDELYLVVDTEDFFRNNQEDAAIPLDSFGWESDDRVVLMSQGTDLPLSLVDYDDTKFKEFKYTGDQEKVDPDTVE